MSVFEVKKGGLHIVKSAIWISRSSNGRMRPFWLAILCSLILEERLLREILSLAYSKLFESTSVPWNRHVGCDAQPNSG